MAPNRNHRSLALLVCGKTTGKTLAENGDYIDIFSRFLQASLDVVQAQATASLENPNHDPRWQFTLDPYDVVNKQEYPTEDKLNDYHGIIITGSRASSSRSICRRTGAQPRVQLLLRTRTWNGSTNSLTLSRTSRRTSRISS